MSETELGVRLDYDSFEDEVALQNSLLVTATGLLPTEVLTVLFYLCFVDKLHHPRLQGDEYTSTLCQVFGDWLDLNQP